MLFSTSFTLGSNKLPIQLQVSPAQSGPQDPSTPHTGALGPNSFFMTAPYPVCLGLTRRGQGEQRGKGTQSV